MMKRIPAVVIAAAVPCRVLMERGEAEKRAYTDMKSANGAVAFTMIHAGVHAGSGTAAPEATTKEKWKREKEEGLGDI